MAVLVDTCILVPAFNPVAGEHRLVRQALLRLTDQGERLVTTPQNLAELWNVCTRPAASNGRGLDPRQVQKMIRILRRMTDLRCESAEALERWAEIVVRHAVRGGERSRRALSGRHAR